MLPRFSSVGTSSPSLQHKEKRVYYRIETEAHEYDWYTINSDRDHDGFLRPVLPSPPRCNYAYGCAAMGSKIYLFGGTKTEESGDESPVSDVYYIDTRHPERGWKKGSDLIIPRERPHCVAIDKKIYVLGYYPRPKSDFYLDYYYRNKKHDKDSDLFAEIYDPSANTASPMIPLPNGVSKFITAHGILEEEGGGKKLFACAGYSRSMHCYDFHSKEWSNEETTRISVSVFQSACLDGVIYGVQGGLVYGYDLVRRKSFRSPVRGLTGIAGVLPYEEDVWEGLTLPTSLVNIGNGKLCLLWCEIFHDDILHIHHTIFTVSKMTPQDDEEVKDGCGLVAQIHSYDVYKVRGYCLVGSLAV